jgi:hypothetical protein
MRRCIIDRQVHLLERTHACVLKDTLGIVNVARQPSRKIVCDPALLPDPGLGGSIPAGIISTGAEHSAQPDTTSSCCRIDQEERDRDCGPFLDRRSCETATLTCSSTVRPDGWPPAQSFAPGPWVFPVCSCFLEETVS